MSGIMKVLLLLAASVCISTALLNESGQNCLCQRTYNSTDGSDLKDIQIYPATIFCDKVEIVVTTGAGHRYCLNHRAKAVKAIVIRILRSKRNAITPPQSS
ncbi:C-X-C motif chemokine 2-like [Hippoglossus hippoglossus]|uniref:Interleukin-8 like protein n=1 Tax=Hippoglossus hippoglossus TaxID=8267 RepID=D0QTG0_HIPHI|nr:C-X-C motif chemokine 2-like [Hippoglossus hippoglossus]XP_035017061.1 C-X-C motif chemokine 2 [Hippoglossus stenolepis]ACY54778.1 interleukin-8 like protein [Hippoglossus hippoglossus]